MDASLALQYAIIAVAVVVSAWVVVKKQFPGPLRKLRIALALPLLHGGRARWQHALGRWIAPAGSLVNGRIAGSDCGGCDGCG
ncbi:DUF6587 family protein [Pseudoxanthomonas sp. SE1]|uniref:DUF6587 family protein n=1 Tax=Pseudoxanthomonas sp. SE1 TaxID=1664560 RepID=UPI00240E7344|nr:DUF6587 family protein [Pseudoxanthomonas sp. SE1]WFC43490.1 hypothetical protein OY559_08335 [Pseudoxanthomonas sp. SE1]